LFHRTRAPRNKIDANETIFPAARRHRETALGYQGGNEITGQMAMGQGTVMIKALSAIAVAACVAAALALLPGFTPQVEASTPHALAKGDRLDVVGRDCSQQAWPNFEASCLRRAGSRTIVHDVRLVTADRAH
jgi:hypothetical protein